VKRLGLIVTAVVAAGLLACGPTLPASLDYLRHVPAEPRLGEITTLEFLATDSRGRPQAGVEVKFSLQNPLNAQGVTLSPAVATTDRTDGVARVQLTTTTRVSSVVVVAEAGGFVAMTPPISFAGAQANARQFTFQCGPIAGEASGGIHAIGAWDQTRYLIAGVKLDCTAHVGDRNGDGVPNAVVSFLTEAGTIGPSETTVSNVIGNATILYKTSNPLPKPVDPGAFSWNPAKGPKHTGQYIVPLWMHPFDWKAKPVADYNLPPDANEPRRPDPVRLGILNNPRDNLVTMIAVTTGEEGFDDVNNNGRFDEGEFHEDYDLTEPFVDSNDNGTWDRDERWVDTDGNGTWDGKNGRHDASTLIWVQERILWTGVPHPRDFQDAEFPIFKQISPPPVVQHFQTAQVTLLISDPWFNVPAQNGTSDGCEVLTGAANPVVKPDQARFGELGIRFTYPSVMLASVGLQDAHDPQKDPPDLPWNDPSRNPSFPGGLPFSVGIGCTYTASPNGGYSVSVSVPSISGVVF